MLKAPRSPRNTKGLPSSNCAPGAGEASYFILCSKCAKYFLNDRPFQTLCGRDFKPLRSRPLMSGFLPRRGCHQDSIRGP